ncbi:hypothetical protein G9A89_007856 [Geosiphon pyriformis]|nr:hypothetical protein G9A89_007856 [Geosiphon pyriformis]
MDPDKIKVVKNFPVPINLTELRAFLEFAGYYHHFIKDFLNWSSHYTSFNQKTPSQALEAVLL